MKKQLIFVLTILVSIQTYAQSEANFDIRYISEMTDSVTYEIPEVQELVHIVFCLTPFGLASDEIIDKQTEYYKEVMSHFSDFKDDKVVKKINQQLRRGRYSRLKMDAVGFHFNGDEIEKSPYYPQLNWDDKNWLVKYIPDLEEFAQKSDFKNFYKKHLPFYNKEVELLKEQLAVRKQWQWLESKFNNRYQSYRITFSPLVGGTHSTNRFKENDFRQAIMFIQSGIQPEDYKDKYTAKQVEGLMGRIVFTEIDHNYVNPLSDKFQKEINEAFNEVSDWNTGKYGYSSPMATFNEYMTHSLYSLFVLDNYSKVDAELIIGKHEELMVERRGFYRYKEFNQLLIETYQNSPSKTMEEFYKTIIPKLLTLDITFKK